MRERETASSDEPGTVLVVDDDEELLRTLSRILQRAGHEVATFNSASRALTALEAAGEFDVVVSDLHMPELSGLDFLAEVRQRWPDTPVIMLSADSSTRSAVQATRLGAYDYIVKPFPHVDEIVLTVRRAVAWRRLVARNRELEERLGPSDDFEGLVGTSRAMRALFRTAESAAVTDATVLLLGESGTGKELLARALHRRSARRARPFLAVNCSALADTLLDSELFGHVRGAFSGAHAGRSGVFEHASGGTLFLDEIGDISPATQVRLLRALQEGEIKPVGSNEVKRVDVRIVAATNRDLRAAVAARTFREDLYYRLNVITIELPPLRERADDVPLLAGEFLRRYAQRFGKAVRRIMPDAMELLQQYAWPGNVRELENVIQRAVALAGNDTLSTRDLPAHLRARPRTARALAAGPFSQVKQSVIASFEQEYVRDLLTRTAGNLTEAARLAGVDKTNLRRLMRRHGIQVAAFRTGELAPVPASPLPDEPPLRGPPARA